MLVFLKTFFTRPIVFYFACFLLVWLTLDYHKLINNAVPQTMSRLTPPIDYFAEFVDREDHYDQFKLMDCIYYHKAVAHFFAYQKAEAYGMLGFCYDRMGQSAQSIDSYKQAIVLNQDYFWPYFDLGVIFYNQAKYQEAEDYFRQAIEQSPIKTIVLLSRSKVYNDVKLSKLTGGPYDSLGGLKQGNIQAFVLLMDSLYRTGSYEALEKVAIEGLKEGLGAQDVFYYYLSLYFHAAGQEESAQMFLAKAAALHAKGSPEIKEYLKVRVRFF